MPNSRTVHFPEKYYFGAKIFTYMTIFVLDIEPIEPFS